MQKEMDIQPCGACFKAGTKVIEEAFMEDILAFGRYAELSRQAKSPALCQENCGTYYVCHIDFSAPRNNQR